MCNPLIVARQWLGKHIPAATNTHTTLEELLDASFSMWSMSYQRKTGDCFFSKLLVIFNPFVRLGYTSALKELHLDHKLQFGPICYII
jgi:hypothetical protein